MSNTEKPVTEKIANLIDTLATNSRILGAPAFCNWEGIDFLVSSNLTRLSISSNKEDTCVVAKEDNAIRVVVNSFGPGCSIGDEIAKRVIAERAWDMIFDLRDLHQNVIVGPKLELVKTPDTSLCLTNKSLLEFVKPKLEAEKIPFDFFSAFVSLLASYPYKSDPNLDVEGISFIGGMQSKYENGEGDVRFQPRLHWPSLPKLVDRIGMLNVNDDGKLLSCIVEYNSHELVNFDGQHHQKVFMEIVNLISNRQMTSQSWKKL